MGTKRQWWPTLAVAAALILTGCGPSEEEPMGTPMEQRPTIEEVEPVSLAMMEDIQQVLTEQFGVGEWVQHREQVRGSGCEEIEGGERRSYNLGSSGPIAAEDWDGALTTVRDIVGEQGFTELVQVVDDPGDHLVDINQTDGGRVSFGTQQATILRVTTGCHPTGPAPAKGD